MLSALLMIVATNVYALGPCDIFATGETPCVAAYSTTRALYDAYNGTLYSVRRASDNATTEIGLLQVGGVADSAAQDAFCGTSDCFISKIFDQSPQKNHLAAAPARRGHVDLEVNATREPITLGGNKVYGAYFEQGPLKHTPKEVGMGYRNDTTTGIAKGDEPETIYMVTAGDHYNAACCFDFGNAENRIGDAGAGMYNARSPFIAPSMFWRLLSIYTHIYSLMCNAMQAPWKLSAGPTERGE